MIAHREDEAGARIGVLIIIDSDRIQFFRSVAGRALEHAQTQCIYQLSRLISF